MPFGPKPRHCPVRHLAKGENTEGEPKPDLYPRCRQFKVKPRLPGRRPAACAHVLAGVTHHTRAPSLQSRGTRTPTSLEAGHLSATSPGFSGGAARLNFSSTSSSGTSTRSKHLQAEAFHRDLALQTADTDQNCCYGQTKRVWFPVPRRAHQALARKGPRS